MDVSKVFEAAGRLKSGLLAKATDGDYLDEDYKEDLSVLNTSDHVVKLLPSLVRTSRSAADFRRAMQAKYAHYSERRQYIDEEFEPLFNYLDRINKGTDNFSNNLDVYEMGEALGSGGFGTVYKYRHKLLNHDFAIKIFEPVFVSNDENTEGENRFFREAKVLFQLNHDNIIRVYDIGRIEGKPFIRMEYVDGCTLQDYISQKGAVSFERSKKPIIAILNGLCYAHKEGVIHRDLKPSNIMVTKQGQFKIIDFGISAYIENESHSKLTKTGEKVAGGLYTDPVLTVDPKLRDVRSDIYSVGAIWYFLLTGRAPSGGDARNYLLDSNNVNELQGTIILKCIASNPQDRYQTCEEIIDILLPEKTREELDISVWPSRLTEITRESIFDYLLERHYEELEAFIYSQNSRFQQPERVFSYSGKKDDVVFLNRLYDLKNMPSYDSRLRTFEEEIKRHTILNDDYDYGWVFKDERLGLIKGADELLLKFLCEMFHPLIRSEKSDWQSVLMDINEIIKIDGYEIYESDKISGRSIYSFRFCV